MISILKERNDTHGSPERSFAAIADAWVKKSPHPEAQVAFLMAKMKVARAEVTFKRDHYLDAIGYLALALAFRERSATVGPWTVKFIMNQMVATHDNMEPIDPMREKLSKAT